MKLNVSNHLFLFEVVMRLKSELNHKIELFNEASVSLLNLEEAAKMSFIACRDGKISEEEMYAALNDATDLAIVHRALDKLTDAYNEAFDTVSTYHITRLESDEACRAS